MKAKKVYQKPRLLRHGSVERVTLSMGGSGLDGGTMVGQMRP
ncbi:MAG: lasso RiPP family leader peptide-containing protein [Kouleothrix sp.]|nr:lasso RiPP family leader peptide-containing protein [Kouleothrix sp.]